MTNIPKFAALVASFGLSTLALAAKAETTDVCPPFAWITVNDAQVQLPADVAENVFKLQSFGTRYARVIDLIIEENARPDWTFAADCVVSNDELAASDR